MSTDQQQALVQLQEQQLRHEALLAERDSAHERHLQRFHAMHAEAMIDGQMRHAEQLCELKDDHAKALADLTSRYTAKVCPISTTGTFAALSRCLNLQLLIDMVCRRPRCEIVHLPLTCHLQELHAVISHRQLHLYCKASLKPTLMQRHHALKLLDYNSGWLISF